MVPRRVHFFKRKALFQQQISSSDVVGSIQFALSEVPGFAEFVTLFDVYQISAVKVAIWGSANVNSVTAVGSGGTTSATVYQLPNVYTAIDYTDDDNPADANELMEYGNCKVTRGNQIHVRYFKPKIAVPVYTATIDPAYQARRSSWLSTDDPGIPHYGLKYVFDIPGGVTSSPYYTFSITYYLRFRQTK